MAVGTRALGRAEPGRTVPLAVGALLLSLIVANSTVQANWVTGAVALPVLAVYGTLAGTLVGLLGMRGAAALALALAPGPPVALVVVSQTVAGDRTAWQLASTWWHEGWTGQLVADPVVLVFLIYALFWLLGAWMAWSLLRRQQALLAVAPAGAALATNVLNFPNGQDTYVFWFLVLTLAVLLWSNYHGSIAAARRRRIELDDGARWEFWERGGLAAAGLVALAVFVPPLTAVDRTVDIQNGLLDTWGRITHSGSGAGDPTSIGLSTDARLGGSLNPTSAVVFTYKIVGTAPGPSYFHALDLQPGFQEWTYQPGDALNQHVSKGQHVIYSEAYGAQAMARYAVTVERPPAAAPRVVLAPGQLDTVDRDINVMQSINGQGSLGGPQLDVADEVTAISGRGAYQVQVEQSVASEDQLRSAGTSYPEWVQSYRYLPRSYRPGFVEQQIRALALRVTAGARNPYDEAVAIESYLRNGTFTYTLTPGSPPPGVDPEQFFLFATKAGYCQYFATAMADMLRSLGVPVRLVNGYGPGAYDSSQNRFVVHESDAHTWPEVYFPAYGWLPFEPTPDGVYLPIPRGGNASVTCTGDSCSAPGAPAPSPAPAPTTRPRAPLPAGPVSTPGQTGFRLPVLRTWTPIAAGALLVLVLLFIGLSRFLRPQTVAGTWQRAMLLLQLAGVRPRTGETPIEFGERVADEFPETAAPIRRLAGDFAVAAYAPTRLAELRKASVLAGWGSLRPLLLRRVAGRARAPRRQL